MFLARAKLSALRRLLRAASFVVETGDVVVNHALHGEVRRDVADRPLDVLYPAWRVACRVLLKVERYDFILEHRVNRCGVEFVLLALVGVCALVGERPAGFFVKAVAFVPPAVEHGEVEYAVHLAFSPDVPDASRGRVGVFSQMSTPVTRRFGNNHVVVFEEDNLAEEFGAVANFYDALDEVLACAVGGVSLTCEDELNRELLGCLQSWQDGRGR